LRHKRKSKGKDTKPRKGRRKNLFKEVSTLSLSSNVTPKINILKNGREKISMLLEGTAVPHPRDFSIGG